MLLDGGAGGARAGSHCSITPRPNSALLFRDHAHKCNCSSGASRGPQCGGGRLGHQGRCVWSGEGSPEVTMWLSQLGLLVEPAGPELGLGVRGWALAAFIFMTSQTCRGI